METRNKKLLLPDFAGTIVESFVKSTPSHDIPNSRTFFFDEIAFMLGKWEGVRNKPLGSAISISNLDGEVVNGPIIIGGDDFLDKTPKPLQPVPLSIPSSIPKTGVKLLDESLKTYAENPLCNDELFVPSVAAKKAAADNGMVLLGVNKSAYFKRESFLESLALLSQKHNSSPSHPIVCICDGAKIHVAVEVSCWWTLGYYVTLIL